MPLTDALRLRGVSGPLQPAALAVAIVAAGGAVAAWPFVGLAFAVAVWGCLVITTLPGRIAVFIPIVTVLVIPADHMASLSGQAHGLLALGVGSLLAVSVLSSSANRIVSRGDWDLYILFSVLVGAGVLHSESGELRNLVFWIAAGLYLFWLRGVEEISATTRSQIFAAVLVAGVVGGLSSIAEYVGLVSVPGIVPGYQPAVLEFTRDVSNRAAGLSGHPLRLGTLTCLAALWASAYLMDGKLTRRPFLLTIGALAISLIGLLLSGARGAWLSFGAGMVVIACLQAGREGMKRVVPIIVGFAALYVVLVGTGLWGLFSERLFGAASHPGSFNQRIQALLAVAQVAVRLPIAGVGFGGADEITRDAGLLVPNLENEYLRFFLAAGVAGPLALVVVGVRRLWCAYHLAPSPLRTGVLAGLTALLVNMATYNVFSWSIGPAVFIFVAFLATPGLGAAGRKGTATP